MSVDWVKDIEVMYAKFGMREWFEKNLAEGHDKKAILRAFLAFRLLMCNEEFQETMNAAMVSKDPEEVVDGLIDMCVFAIGTLVIMGVDANEAWDKVYNANIVKEPGVKPERPNPWGLPDLIKPDGWVNPDHEGNHGDLPELLED